MDVGVNLVANSTILEKSRVGNEEEKERVFRDIGASSFERTREPNEWRRRANCLNRDSTSRISRDRKRNDGSFRTSRNTGRRIRKKRKSSNNSSTS